MAYTGEALDTSYSLLRRLPEGVWFHTAQESSKLTLELQPNESCTADRIMNLLPPAVWDHRWEGWNDWWKHTTHLKGVEVYIFGDKLTPPPVTSQEAHLPYDSEGRYLQS